jgi:hypothetical protein
VIEHMPKQCPLCGAGVSQSRFAELQAKIHEEERRKLEEAMSAARDELDRKHQEALVAQAEAFRVQAEERDAQQAADLAAERERIDRDFAERFENGVARAVKEASAPLESGLKAANDETQELRGVINELQVSLSSATSQRQAEIDAAVADAERRHVEHLAQISKNAEGETTERIRLEGVVAEFEAKWKALSEAKEAESKAALAEAERQHQEELAQQRTILEKDRDDQVRKAKAQHLEDDQKVQKRVADLQRQIEKKTADDLGHWAEVDLYQSLQEEFQDDRVTRIAKGEEGADIIVEVMHRGESCGKIVLDSKNRKAWRDGYVDKLHQDQVDAKAEHAVLATNVFPAGTNHLCIRGGVIVVRPLSVVPIVRIVRTSLVNNHTRQLSAQQREEKAAKLYEYINSNDFRQAIASAVQACEELEELDVHEKRDHDKVWHRRGKLERDIAKALGNAESRMNEIVETPNEDAAAVTAPRIA